VQRNYHLPVASSFANSHAASDSPTPGSGAASIREGGPTETRYARVHKRSLISANHLRYSASSRFDGTTLRLSKRPTLDRFSSVSGSAPGKTSNQLVEGDGVNRPSRVCVSRAGCHESVRRVTHQGIADGIGRSSGLMTPRRTNPPESERRRGK